MLKNIVSIIAVLAASPAFSMCVDQPQECAPESMKGKRITFFFDTCRCNVDDPAGAGMVQTKPGVTLRFVNFNYGNTSNGNKGGSMVYSKKANSAGGTDVIIYDKSYSGSGYRVKGNSAGDSGEWHLFFEYPDKGSAWFMGKENGVLTYYFDVPFVITPVGEAAAKPHCASSCPRTAPAPGGAGCAPESMEDMVITLMPLEGQDIENQEWAMHQMYFGRDHEQDGRRFNHITAFRQFGQSDLRFGNWVNAFLGETEQILYPGYYDYRKLPDGTASIRLSGECTAVAYYILSFDSPTTGTLTFHHEDDGEDGPVVCAHIEGIPFKVTHRDSTNPATLKRGEDPEVPCTRSFKALD